MFIPKPVVASRRLGVRFSFSFHNATAAVDQLPPIFRDLDLKDFLSYCRTYLASNRNHNDRLECIQVLRQILDDAEEEHTSVPITDPHSRADRQARSTDSLPLQPNPNGSNTRIARGVKRPADEQNGGRYTGNGGFVQSPKRPKREDDQAGHLPLEPAERQQQLDLLHTITVPPTRNVGLKEWKKARNDFYVELLTATVDVRHQAGNEVKHGQRIGPEDARKITNLFFGSLMGRSAPSGLQRLVKQHMEYLNSGVPARQIKRVEEAAKNPQHSAEFRELMGRLARVLPTTPHHSDPLDCFQYIHGLVKFSEYIDWMETAAKRPRSRVWKTLQRAEPVLGQGDSVRSRVMRYLANTEDISMEAVRSLRRKAQGARQLVKHLGYGILLVLPTEAISQFHHWGLQKMERALKLFVQHAPFVLEISAALEKHIYRAITKDRKLPFEALPAQGNLPFVERISRAAEGARTGETT